MEVLGFVTSVLGLFDFISESVSLSHEPSKLYDSTNSWKPLLKAEQNFLEIIDIPFSPRKPARLLLKANNIDNMDDALKTLPTHEMHCIRVYFVENLGVHGKTSPIATPSYAGSPAMISQWCLSSRKIRWETSSYRLSLSPTLKGAKTGNGEHPYIDSVSISAGTIRRTLRCMIVSIEDGRLVCEYTPLVRRSQSLIISPYRGQINDPGNGLAI